MYYLKTGKSRCSDYTFAIDSNEGAEVAKIFRSFDPEIVIPLLKIRDWHGGSNFGKLRSLRLSEILTPEMRESICDKTRSIEDWVDSEKDGTGFNWEAKTPPSKNQQV